MKAFARWLERVPELKRLRPMAVVRDFELTLLDELDLMREAANTAHLKRNFKDSELLYVPKVYWDYCAHNVMVSERIFGTSVDEIQALSAQGVDLKVLAERGVEIFFTQVFRDRFFHADMHAGNVFVDATNPAQPKYIAIDCGIVGTLAEEDQHYLAMNLLAFFNRDYHQVARLHVESGWVPKDTPIHHFEQSIRAVCEPIFARPLKDISFGLLLVRLFQVARRFNMEVQPQLVLLQKTLLNIEGLGRQLYPELDLWQTGKPYMEQWLRDRISAKRIAQSVRAQLPFILERLPDWPHHLERMVKTLGTPAPEPTPAPQSTAQGALLGLLVLGIGLGTALWGDWVHNSVLFWSGFGIGACGLMLTAQQILVQR
jgi:ubiquinone biosynthesis protein